MASSGQVNVFKCANCDEVAGTRGAMKPRCLGGKEHRVVTVTLEEAAEQHDPKALQFIARVVEDR